MMSPAFELLERLHGKTIATAESCTGGGIGAALTAVPGASAVYKGGIISYCNEIKTELLHVPTKLLKQYGAVSAPVAEAMAKGVRKALRADVAVSVTGLAGPTGDEFGNPVGTVFIGFACDTSCVSWRFLFEGTREEIRMQAVETAFNLVLQSI